MAPPRLLYLVTEDWYFLQHRLSTARAARAAGYDVHVATHVGEDGGAIEAEGFTLHPLPWRRGSVNPLHFVGSIARVRRLYREVRPDLVHHVGLQAIVLGSLAGSGLDIPSVNALLGMGYVFTSRGAKARLVRPLVARLLPFLFNQRGSVLVVENPDDRAEMMALGVPAERIEVIAGTAVDLDKADILPEPPDPITLAFVGRMLDDKGVRVLVAAHQMLVRRGRPIRLLLAGEPDPANPTSIPPAELAAWSRLPQLQWLGHVDDIPGLWARAHIAVLPSRREGLPQSLLEAAGHGRPIVSTDVPGCREIALDRVNALLVAPDDPAGLAEAIDRLADDADLRRRFGAAGRALVEERFSNALVSSKILALYDRMRRR